MTCHDSIDSDAEIYCFGNCQLDATRRMLWRRGEQVRLEPLVFDLLLFFVRSNGVLISHDELIDQVWAGRRIARVTINTYIYQVREAVEDTPEERLLVTVAKRGFCFLAPVQRGRPP